MDNKILKFLKRELIAGFGGRCGVGVDSLWGTLRSNVAAADYQPSFPLHTAAKSQVPRMLILHTKRLLKMVHGDLNGQAPSAVKLQTFIQILHAHSYYWYRISCRPPTVVERYLKTQVVYETK
jgi:hypothetical protein